MPERWWEGHLEEIYWVEITDRGDLGVDLAAPQLNEEGQPYWSYDLVREVREGDVVLHYAARPSNAITHWSRASGQPYEDSLVWGAHGQASGRGPVTPYLRPAWRRPLDGPYALDQPVTMGELRDAEDEIRRVYLELREQHGERTPLYFPFQLSDSRPVRAFQGYMAKNAARPPTGDPRAQAHCAPRTGVLLLAGLLELPHEAASVVTPAGNHR